MKVRKGSIGEAFKESLFYLWDGDNRRKYTILGTYKERYICLALGKVFSDFGTISQKQRDKAIAIVDKRLKGETVLDWLITNKYIDFNEAPNKREVQRYRRRWVLSLIEEFANVMP